ncbi:MAG: PD-(D/E)XK nuclease family protein [Candidatus Zixiibacteriota bacterium]
MKPQLHSTHLSTLMRCPKQYEFRYVNGLVIPPGVALHIGSATHDAIAKNLKHKAETGGALLPVSDVQDLARDSVAKRWDSEDVYLQDDEAERGRDTMRAETIDTAVALAALHATELAPIIQPISAAHVERKWVLEIGDLPFDLAGTIDVQESGRIRDTKTAKKTPTQGDVDSNEQFTMYALAASVIDSDVKPPVDISVDALIKTKQPKSEILQTKRMGWQMRALVETIKSYSILIQAGHFPPNTSGWWCSRTWCGYASRCPFYSGRP